MSKESMDDRRIYLEEVSSAQDTFVKQKRRLVAKTIGIDLNSDEVSLFPTESASGVVFSQEEIFELSSKYSRLYKSLIHAVAKSKAAYFNLNIDVAEIISRETVPALTHFFFDRLLRMVRMLEMGMDFDLIAPFSPFLAAPSRPEDFRELAGNSEIFNQNLLRRLAEIWQIPAVAEEGQNCSPARIQKLKSERFVNNNFLARTFFRRACRRFYFTALKFLSAMEPKWRGQVPALRMSYATAMLEDHYFYGFTGLVDLRSCLRLTSHDPVPKIRQAVIVPALNDAQPALDKFLDSIGFDSRPIKERIYSVFLSYVCDFYMTEFLEGIPTYMKQARGLLEPFRGRPLVTSEYATTEITYLIAGAKSLSMKTIGVQEGGHYGWEDDTVSATEMQYPFFDYFITWGWQRFPDEVDKIKAIPLPAPWLAARRRYWQLELEVGSRRYGTPKPFDFLFMPNKIYAYPPAPSGGAVSRIDHIKNFAAMIKELVTRARGRGVRILCKPYNETTLALLAQTWQDLERLGGDCYQSLSHLNKGLTKDLLAQCHVVLWDQPGTGFLECLACGIPTMIYWKRFYNRELPWTRPIFAELESVGVIHTQVETLLNEMVQYKQAPLAWMQDAQRKDVVARFCKEFAWTEDDWPRYWRGFLKDAREGHLS